MEVELGVETLPASHLQRRGGQLLLRERSVLHAPATSAEEVRMAVRLPHVETVGALDRSQLQHLSDLPERLEGVVDRCQAGGRKLLADALVDGLRARVVLVLDERPHDGEQLGGQAISRHDEQAGKLVDSAVGVVQITTVTM